MCQCVSETLITNISIYLSISSSYNDYRCHLGSPPSRPRLVLMMMMEWILTQTPPPNSSHCIISSGDHLVSFGERFELTFGWSECVTDCHTRTSSNPLPSTTTTTDCDDSDLTTIQPWLSSSFSFSSWGKPLRNIIPSQWPYNMNKTTCTLSNERILSVHMCVQFDRSNRGKSDSLCGLEEVLSQLTPSVFIDEQLSKYKVSGL